MIIFCGQKFKVFGMHVINPSQVVRFLSFLICYTPKRHPPTEGRILTNSQGRKQRLLKIAPLQKAQSLLKIYNTTAFRYYSGNTMAVKKVIWPWLRQFFCFIHFSDQIPSTKFFIRNVLKFPFFIFLCQRYCNRPFNNYSPKAKLILFNNIN